MKRQFVDDVLELVDGESLLLNHPYDGSLFAYGLDGANLYYRHMSGYSGADDGRELDVSEKVRLHANEVSSDEEIAQILFDLDVRYVLKLGETPEWSSIMFPNYIEEDWIGIESISDDTPGFSVVLAKDEMRLYEVELS